MLLRISTPMTVSSFSEQTEPIRQLNAHFEHIRRVILDRQHPISGLLPASTAITVHGNYTDAWVRDNVYSILAVWGLALAFRKYAPGDRRTYELEYSLVRLMRGLLTAMMRQAAKVEQFKHSQDPLNALHAKYDTRSGEPVVGDDEWGHLQLDATSLYLLMLAQMIASGFDLIWSLDEVNFIQNLVYYIGRTYRTPDYGIWERGNKINHGNPELNASSIGMAKAALEVLSGFNLFGSRGDQASVVHVLPDEITRMGLTLTSLLPRESASKEVDAATLSVIGFPAFAVEDRALVERTRRKIVEQLQGRYGCKRFLRDGHQTVLEDTTRLHYEPWELKQFEHIECEWPLFFCYLLLDSLFQGDKAAAQVYRERLSVVQVHQAGLDLLPELYYVPENSLEAERTNPSSQTRLPNENVPLVWAQSLYWLGQMLQDGLLDPGDLDPLGRRLHRRSLRPQVQVALIAEDEILQAELSAYGIPSQTPREVAPIQIRHAEDLALVYAEVGCNELLGLSGRPIRRLRSLTTSRIYRLAGELVVFLPACFDPQQFYLTLDYHFLVAQIRSELAYLQQHWQLLGCPTLTLLLTRTLFESGRAALLSLMQELKAGECNGVQVKLGPLQQMLRTAAIERIDNLQGFRFPEAAVQNRQLDCWLLSHDAQQDRPLSHTQEFAVELETDSNSLLNRLLQSANLYEQTELLQSLVQLEGLDWDTGWSEETPILIRDLLTEVYLQASQRHYWGIIRRIAGLLGWVDMGLSDAVIDLLIRQKQIAVGKAYTPDSLITHPLSAAEIAAKILAFCREDIRELVLTQELLLYLDVLIKDDPAVFKGFLMLRVGYLILLLTSELAAELDLTQDEAYECLMQLSPFEVKQRLRQVMRGYDNLSGLLRDQESLHLRSSAQAINWQVDPSLVITSGLDEAPRGWRWQRQRDGAFSRVPRDFYPAVWAVMHHCQGLVIGDKLERRNRLDSKPLIFETTPGEKNFALRVEHLLNKIDAPEYRHVNVEALMALAAFVQENPSLQIGDYIVLDVLIGHAVRLAWLADHPPDISLYESHKTMAWQRFYEESPAACQRFVIEAMRFLLELMPSMA